MVRVISCIWTISWQENWPSPVLFKFSFVTNIFFQVLLELLCRTGMGLWSLDPDVCLLRWTFSSSEQTTIINVHWHGFWGTASEGTGAHSWLLKKQKEPWAWWVGESWQTSLFLWVTFFFVTTGTESCLHLAIYGIHKPSFLRKAQSRLEVIQFSLCFCAGRGGRLFCGILGFSQL